MLYLAVFGQEIAKGMDNVNGYLNCILGQFADSAFAKCPQINENVNRLDSIELHVFFMSVCIFFVRGV